jgi:hypothetical protein
MLLERASSLWSDFGKRNIEEPQDSQTALGMPVGAADQGAWTYDQIRTPTLTNHLI